MRVKYFLGLVLFFTVLVACKDEKSVDSLELVRPEVVDDFFRVKMEVLVKNDDDFSLFYTEDGSTNFNLEPIWIGVKGSSSLQEIAYQLPKDVYPTQLRLDFGLKQKLDEVLLKKVVFIYKGSKLEISGLELGKYFRADENKCTFDPTTGIIKPIEKDGTPQFPSLYPLEVEMEKALVSLAK
jgi:hypothetical protein